MLVRRLVLTGALLTTGGLVAASPASAQVVCDAYSENCFGSSSVSDPDTGPGRATSTTERPTTLPFTGGELVLLTTLGAGALAGGTALVVAGRRKQTAQS